MIVKHENRIRALEGKEKAAEEEEGRVGDGLRVGRPAAVPPPANNDDNQHGTSDHEDLAPDEV